MHQFVKEWILSCSDGHWCLCNHFWHTGSWHFDFDLLFETKSPCQSFYTVTGLQFDLSQLVVVVARGSVSIGEMEQFCHEAVTLGWHIGQHEQGAGMEAHKRSSVPPMSVTATRLLSVCVTSHHSRSNHFSHQTGPVMLTSVWSPGDVMDCQVQIASKLPQWDVKGHTKYECDFGAAQKTLCSEAEQDAGRSGRVKVLFSPAGAILKEHEILLTLQFHLKRQSLGWKRAKLLFTCSCLSSGLLRLELVSLVTKQEDKLVWPEVEEEGELNTPLHRDTK